MTEPVTPFHVRYTLTRRQRVGELLPWLPALAASIGFGIGGVYLSGSVTLALVRQRRGTGNKRKGIRTDLGRGCDRENR